MQKDGKSGFTLIELSVVLIIIGLVAVSIVSGRTIVQASESRAVMAEIRKHMQSFSLFSERYRAYPGDFRNASTVFKTAIDAAVAGSAIGLTPGDYNGNGNNQVEWANAEGVKAWAQLALAGLGDATSINADPRSTNGTLRVNIPASNIGGGGNGYFINYSPTMQNYLGLGGAQTTGINDRSALSPDRAEAIDKKMDDDNPIGGLVQAQNGTPPPASNCTNTLNGYNLGSSAGDTISCILMIRLN